MLKADAQIICRKTPYGAVCKWEGGKVALASSPVFRELGDGGIVKSGEVYNVGRLKIRAVALAPSYGAYDEYFVMLESPHAQLYWLYREKAEQLIRLILNLEARVRGFMLQPVHGEVMPFTKKVADYLLCL